MAGRNIYDKNRLNAKHIMPGGPGNTRFDGTSE
jgi:hypothetical protein